MAAVGTVQESDHDVRNRPQKGYSTSINVESIKLVPFSDTGHHERNYVARPSSWSAAIPGKRINDYGEMTATALHES